MSAHCNFAGAIATADRTLPGADLPEVERRRVADRVSGYVIGGLFNGIRIDRVSMAQDFSSVWVGQVDWLHPLLARPPEILPRRLEEYHRCTDKISAPGRCDGRKNLN